MHIHWTKRLKNLDPCDVLVQVMTKYEDRNTQVYLNLDIYIYHIFIKANLL